ncbi:AAA family ATPase [Nautilia sp.]
MLPKKIQDRKTKLNFENTVISGPKGVGKTFLVFSFLESFNGKYKYLDFADYREKNFDFEGYDLVIFDNFDFSVEIPETTVFIITDKNIEVDGFRHIRLKGLDFEEFFSFDNSQSITHSFDKFLKTGNFPRSVFLEDYFKEEYLKEQFELLPYNKEIIKFYFSHIGEKFTLYQIYQILKKRIKISKDRFYKTTGELLEKRVIFEVDKFNSPKSPKKFYSYNFAFKNILTNRKNILLTFENIIFLELNEDEIYYKDTLSFYLPQKELGIMVMPFANEEILKEKLKKVKNVNKVQVITISNEFEFEHKNFEVEVTPFWQWRFAE